MIFLKMFSTKWADFSFCKSIICLSCSELVHLLYLNVFSGHNKNYYNEILEKSHRPNPL